MKYLYQDGGANHWLEKVDDAGNVVDSIQLSKKGTALVRSSRDTLNCVTEKIFNQIRANRWTIGKAGAIPQYFACYNYKGGIGKTALSIGLGLALAKKGKRVLLVDADPQSSLSISFLGHNQWWAAGLKDESIFNLFKPLNAKDWDNIGNPKLIDGTVKWLDDPSLGGSLGLMVGSPSVATLEANLAFGVTEGKKSASLKLCNSTIQAFYGIPEYTVSQSIDYVIFDAPPSFTLTTISLLLVVDSIIAPIDNDLATFYGLWIFSKLRETVIENNEVRGVAQDKDHFHDAVAQCKYVVPSRYEGNVAKIANLWEGLKSEPNWKSILNDVNFCGPGIPYNQTIAKSLQDGAPLELLDHENEFSYFEKTAQALFGV